MPVKKVTQEKSVVSAEKACSMCTPFMNDFGKKIIWTLVGVLLVYGIFFLGTLIQKNIEALPHIGQADKSERSISVEAEGKVSVRPDIAMTTMGMTVEAETLVDAQKKNTDVINTLLTRLKALGIEDADIQTDQYNVYPRYDYTDEGREMRGYEVSQQVKVKIRDIEKSNKVLALAGEVGATNVSGLTFTIDDTEEYLAQAREEALAKIQEKASTLDRLLGIRRVSIMSYDEYEVSQGNRTAIYKDSAMSLGGEAPEIEAGENEIKLHVRITFEIR
ncbi:SIMPL domain-containing protein [Patescibacteria group bacterium]|nr:SIMPL domain-containing protein [Patescibacteria group bacterium]MBU1722180.1 SIMPL domain-containing protein [Patescibacteria group bacterium]MBU1901131.1 SIMPL domain-containing protein [Patescibacteria group bacterium]